MFFAIVISLILGAGFDKFDISEQVNVQKWSQAGKSLAAVIFALISFLVLAGGAFIFSPMVVKVLAGPSGIWARVSSQVVAERQHALALAGENFKLIRLESGNIQMIIGALLTVVSILILVYMMTKGEEEGE